MPNKRADHNLKLKIIKDAKKTSINSASKIHNISRVSITKWIKIYDEFGAEGLKKKKTSYKPNNLFQKINKTDLNKIIECKKNNLNLNAREILEKLNLDYSIQFVNKKFREFKLKKAVSDKNYIKSNEQEPFTNFKIKIIKLKNFNPNLPSYQIYAIDIQTGLIFIGFAFERTQLSLSIFIDYILKNLTRYLPLKNKITIHTTNGKEFSESSQSNDSIFKEIIISKYKAQHLTHNKIIGIEKNYEIFNNSENIKKLLLNSLSYIIYCNNLRKDLNKENRSPKEIILLYNKRLKKNTIDTEILRVPPIIVDKFIRNINEIVPNKSNIYAKNISTQKLSKDKNDDFCYVSEKERENTIAEYLEGIHKKYRRANDRLDIAEALKINSILTNFQQLKKDKTANLSY